EEQIETVHCVAEQARLPLLATVLSPLAAFLAISTRIASSAPVLFVDVDDHALACGLLHKTKPPEQGALSLSHSLTLPHLGRRHWKKRLLNHTAERCIRHSRRDPRESADAEQALYDQLDSAMEKCRQGDLAEVEIQTAHWYQDFYLRPDELEQYCAGLVHMAVAAMQPILAAAAEDTSTGAVAITA